jgi:hypothetical protein
VRRWYYSFFRPRGFDSHHLDLAPIYEKDLDPAAETYIEDAMREIGPRQPAKLLIYLPEAARSTAEALTLPDAVSHYFGYRAAQTRIELRRLLRRQVHPAAAQGHVHGHELRQRIEKRKQQQSFENTISPHLNFSK